MYGCISARRSPFVLTRPGGKDTRSGGERRGGSKTKQKPKCKQIKHKCVHRSKTLAPRSPDSNRGHRRHTLANVFFTHLARCLRVHSICPYSVHVCKL